MQRASILGYAPTTSEPPHDKTNKMACAPSEDSVQSGHPPSLIRVFAVRMKKAWVISYPLSAQRRHWSGWSESSLGAKVILLVLSWGGSFLFLGQFHETQTGDFLLTFVHLMQIFTVILVNLVFTWFSSSTFMQIGRVINWLWYLSHRRPAKAQVCTYEVWK